MNPRRVTASNYRTFERLDIDLPTGTVAVTGPNGAGKSSILNLIDIALFADRGELPPLLTVGEDELEIGIEFEHDNEVYRIRRQYSARGRGKSVLDFEREGPGWHVEPDQHGEPEQVQSLPEWEALTRETTQATQDLICRTLGLSRTMFRASSFLAQGDGAAFSEAAPRDRKAILAEILGLGMWDELAKVAHVEFREAETSVAVTAGQIAMCEEQVARLGDVLEMLTALRELQTVAADALTGAESELADAQQTHAAAATLAETVRVRVAELAAATEAHERAVQAFSDATKASHELADRTIELGEVTADAGRVAVLEERLSRLRVATEKIAARAALLADVSQRETGLGRLRDQILQLREAATIQRRKADHLEEHVAESESCDRCGQTLGAEAAVRAAQSYRDEANDLSVKADLIAAEVDASRAELIEVRERADAIIIPADIEDPAPVEQALRAARAAAVQAAALTAQVEQLAAKAAKVDELEAAASMSLITVAEKQTALEKAQADVPDMAVLDSRVALAQAAVRNTRAIVETRQADIVRAEADLERIREAEIQLAASQATITETRARVDLLKLAERAYGRDGIPALIVENAAIPQIEVAANDLLQMMPMADGTTFRVELRTQRALKTSDHLKETLDILIHAGDYIRPYETFSEGEHGRQNICLRIALSLLLAHRRGAQSKLLAIDEIPYLDDLGKEQLVAVVQHVSSHFDRILMISHESALRDAFDQRIVIAKDDDGCSRIVGSVEAVPA